MALSDPCALTLILGANDTMVDNRKPWAVSKDSTLCYLGDMLNAGGGSELAAVTHC